MTWPRRSKEFSEVARLQAISHWGGFAATCSAEILQPGAQSENVLSDYTGIGTLISHLPVCSMCVAIVSKCDDTEVQRQLVRMKFGSCTARTLQEISVD